ncbi:hypothetical protein YC2023_016184 [Brassica napus]
MLNELESWLICMCECMMMSVGMKRVEIGLEKLEYNKRGTFGAQKKCIKRSTDEQRTRATSPERRREVNVTHIPERPGQSDAPRSLASPWRDDPGATSSERHSQVAREETTRERRLRSDTARSLAKKRPGSDLSQRRAEAYQGQQGMEVKHTSEAIYVYVSNVKSKVISSG